MCGIAGIFDIRARSVDPVDVQNMCDTLSHRGPNDEGFYVKGSIGIGMRRLSVIDIATGQQPVRNESGTIQAIQNGEIYNYRELRQQLESKGHTFYTSTDTEVIVHLYEEYGPRFVEHLNGMFAIAIWDEPAQKLTLARDRLGVKPLYYGEFDGRFVFASELKALLQLPDVPRELNWSSVGHLFTFLTTPKNESILAGIHKLEPGHLLTIVQGRDPKIHCYWDVRFEPDHTLNETECVDQLRELLDESVRSCMVADVPLGSFLSGGIDSSAVVATMASHSPTAVKTFSAAFAEKEFNEAPFARDVARQFGTEHHELLIEPHTLDLDDLAWKLDEPFGDSSALPTYMISRLAAEHVTVALSGDGGDELFAGYSKYLVEARERRYRHIPSPLRRLMGAMGGHMPEGMKGRRFLRHIALDGPERYQDANSLFNAEDRGKLLSAAAAEKILTEDPWQERLDYLRFADTHWLSSIQYLDLKHYLPLDVLTKVDRMSMASSLEVRVPLLDHRLVEFAATIPADYQLKNGTTKHLLKRAMRGILPDSIIDRRKQGFAVPLGRWFRGELSEQLHDLLLSPSSRSRNLLNHAYVEKLLALHKAGRPLELQLWTLVSLELWCRRFLDNSPPLSRTRHSDQPVLRADPRPMVRTRPIIANQTR